jgi:hypothetical protein
MKEETQMINRVCLLFMAGALGVASPVVARAGEPDPNTGSKSAETDTPPSGKDVCTESLAGDLLSGIARAMGLGDIHLPLRCNDPEPIHPHPPAKEASP